MPCVQAGSYIYCTLNDNLEEKGKSVPVAHINNFPCPAHLFQVGRHCL